jgi:hypothetical protein
MGKEQSPGNSEAQISRQGESPKPAQAGGSEGFSKQEPPQPTSAKVNKSSEQLWQPVLPKDRQKIGEFVNDLVQNKEEVLGQLQSYLLKPNKTEDEMALGIYLDVALKRDVFGIDPFASKQLGGGANQESREYIALLAAEQVARTWLKAHPDSQLAELIADLSIYAPDFMHRAFLYEMWSSVSPQIGGKE